MQCKVGRLLYECENATQSGQIATYECEYATQSGQIAIRVQKSTLCGMWDKVEGFQNCCANVWRIDL